MSLLAKLGLEDKAKAVKSFFHNDNLHRKQMSINKKVANVQKHLRIGLASTGHQRRVHLEKARTLAEKYGIKF